MAPISGNFNFPTVMVMAENEYRAPGQSYDSPPDPNVAAYIRVMPCGGSSSPSGSYQGVEVFAKTDGAIEVQGYVPQGEVQAQIDTAVDTATPPESSVLPTGYSHQTQQDANGNVIKVRLVTPGGRWVEYDPSANTFLVG